MIWDRARHKKYGVNSFKKTLFFPGGVIRVQSFVCLFFLSLLGQYLASSTENVGCIVSMEERYERKRERGIIWQMKKKS